MTFWHWVLAGSRGSGWAPWTFTGTVLCVCWSIVACSRAPGPSAGTLHPAPRWSVAVGSICVRVESPKLLLHLPWRQGQGTPFWEGENSRRRARGTAHPGVLDPAQCPRNVPLLLGWPANSKNVKVALLGWKTMAADCWLQIGAVWGSGGHCSRSVSQTGWKGSREAV